MTRMKELIEILNEANRHYYGLGEELMSDKEYDSLYDELKLLEESLGIVLSTSPTTKVGYPVVSGLKKATHDSLLLSLDKTKSAETLRSFLGEHEGLLSWKLDGLNLSAKYEDGELVQAITRGNGQIGEDITHNARVMKNLPLKVPHMGSFTVNGEAVIKYDDFEEINKNEGGKYKNPRNLVSGAMRLLNSEASAKRPVYFFCHSVKFPDGDNYNKTVSCTKKSQKLEWLKTQGFEVVSYRLVNSFNLLESITIYESEAKNLGIATDGLVLTYDDIRYSEGLGATSKFPRDSLAFKWQDEIAKTTLQRIEWNTSRTGLINPVAVFLPVEIEGTMVSRASVHNVSILRQLELCPGDEVTVYKANMVIPQIGTNLCKTETARIVSIPKSCPECGCEAAILGEPETLNCTNEKCPARLVGSLVHFAGRDGLNIQGLSEQTIEKFCKLGFLKTYVDLFELEKLEAQITALEGFGGKSFKKLVAGINEAKKVSLASFIFALGIRHIGLANAKLLCDYFDYDYDKIINECKSEDYAETLAEIKGFGRIMADSLHEYFSVEENVLLFYEAEKILDITRPEKNENLPLSGKTFVITGEVMNFKNRKEMQNYIEAKGGRVATSVSSKTDFLVTNDENSTSSKNKKAAALGVKVINEEALLKM